MILNVSLLFILFRIIIPVFDKSLLNQVGHLHGQPGAKL